MFSIGGVLIFVALAIYLALKAHKLRRVEIQTQESKDHGVLAYFFSWVFCVVAVVWLALAIAIPYSEQIGDFTGVQATKGKISLYQERRDNLVAVVKVELSKYPEYEKAILGNINPQILVSFPTLKSNETIVKTMEQIVKLEDDVYKLRGGLIDQLRGMYEREISPWVIYTPSYEHFFKEKNPLSVLSNK